MEMELVKVLTVRDIGAMVRGRRQELGVTQAVLAGRAQVGREWLVGLERGRQRAEVGHILRVLSVLELEIDVAPAPADRDGPGSELDAILDRHRSA
jgi:HTH-type transcriptional regulator / antitoxin HipB